MFFMSSPGIEVSKALRCSGAGCEYHHGARQEHECAWPESKAIQSFPRRRGAECHLVGGFSRDDSAYLGRAKGTLDLEFAMKLVRGAWFLVLRMRCERTCAPWSLADPSVQT